MNTYLTAADSIIGSLCREIDYIRQRYKNVSISLDVSKDKFLRQRLLNEIFNLKKRRYELLKISTSFNHLNKSSLSMMFLYELCKRPLET